MAAPRPDLRVFEDPAALARGAAVELAYRAGEAIRARGNFTVALAGGNTPRRLYELLADEREPFRAGIRWSRIELFWGDERCVSPDHPESNFRMAQEALISRVPVPPENVHRIHGEDPDPSAAAEEYERVVRGFFESRGLMARGLPRLDLVLLGLGADGHTASLFPGSEAVRETSHLVAAPYVETLASHRITLTPPLLNNAACVLFLVSGSEKAAPLRAVLRPDSQSDVLPARAIRPVEGELTWLVDRAAAGDLDRSRDHTTMD